MHQEVASSQGQLSRVQGKRSGHNGGQTLSMDGLLRGLPLRLTRRLLRLRLLRLPIPWAARRLLLLTRCLLNTTNVQKNMTGT